jgi:fatty acid desaturase
MSVTDSEIRSLIAQQKLTTPMSWRSAGHLAVVVALYAVLAVVTVRIGGWWLPVCWFVMAWLLVGSGATIHETTHNHLFRSHRLNRVVGAAFGVSVAIPWGVYRAYHRAHHRYAITDRDPEGEPYHLTSRWQYLLVPGGSIVFFGQILWFGLRTLAGRPPAFVGDAKSARMARVDTVVMLVALGVVAVASTGWFDVVLAVWLGPWLIAAMVLIPFVLLPEHYGADTDDAASALATTTTIQSNRLVRWVYWSNNLHTGHHLASAVVPQRMQHITDEAIVPHLAPRWHSTGYLRWHRDNLLQPRRIAPQPTPVAAGTSPGNAAADADLAYAR